MSYNQSRYGNRNRGMMGDIDFKTMFKMGDVSDKTRSHIREVYTLLTFMTMICAAGMYTNSSFAFAQSFLLQIGSVILMVCTQCYIMNPHNSENKRKYALAFLAFWIGFTLGPAIHFLAEFEPEILTKAFLYTGCTFLSFSALALFSKRRSLLFVGGIAFTIMQAAMLYRFVGWVTGFGSYGIVYLFGMPSWSAAS